MKQKNSFTLYQDYWEWLKLLTDEELGRLLRAIFIYEREQKMPKNLDSSTVMAFSVIKNKLDSDRIQYEKICSLNKQRAHIRWQKAEEERQQT
ncbi:MAG: hypothetical protein IJZ35_08470 [Clostridia bacterium]|nr:hypothetical protein [Clostridia bacterium]